MVCDFFMGGCSTARVAVGMNRRFVGFELSESAFKSRVPQMAQIEPGDLLQTIQTPANGHHHVENARKRWTQSDIDALAQRYRDLARDGKGKGEIVQILSTDFKRGSWSIRKLLKKL